MRQYGRLQGECLLSPATLELVEGYVEVKSLGPVPVKGLADPVEVYKLVGVGSARSRLQAAAARGLTRFVGRDPEVAQLVRALEKARNGQGQLVAVVGDPGVGKSRLYYELARSHRTQGWLVRPHAAEQLPPRPGVVRLGRARTGRAVLPDGRAVARKAWLRGYMYAHSGRVAEGLTLLENALQTREAMGLGVFNSLIAMHLGEAHILAGRLENARAVAGRGLAMARDRGERSYEAYALRLLGEITPHRDPVDIGMAETHYREALVLAEELGMRPLGARCHLGLGTLYRRAGRPERAKDHLTTATTMLRDMGMHLWLAQAEVELQQVS